MFEGLLGQSTGYKAPKTTFGQKIRNLGSTIVDSRCTIIKYVLSMLIVTILLFMIKRYWFKVSKESPIMSDFALTFALIGATLGLKAATAAGLSIFAPFKCPVREEQMAARAARNGATPDAEAYDAMLKQDGRAVLMLPAVNYAEGNLEPAREMMQHPHTIYGLGDGGAHLGFLCDASQPTHMLYYWARDRVKGPRIPLPEVIRGLSAQTAEAVGLHDRGTLTLGAKADINVIDLAHVFLHTPHVVYDLPAGGRRLTQDAEGYDATIVSGVVIQRNGKDTGARPGRLVRGAKAAATV